MRWRNITWCLLLLVPFGLAALGCGGSEGKGKNNPKVTGENFDKIKDSMGEKEVAEILGEPTKTKEVDVTGGKGKQVFWESGSSSIMVEFDAKGKQTGNKQKVIVSVK